MGANQEPRLLVDGTAGRLARWLRILGIDAEGVATGDVAALVRHARQSARRMVTRNRNLAERLGPGAIYLTSQCLEEQLRQVVRAVGRERCSVFSRCSICNERLAEIPKEQVAGRVPAYVYANHERFACCPVCGRYYWQGTHWQHMLEEIQAVLEGKRDG